MDIPLDFNFGGTYARNPPKDAKAENEEYRAQVPTFQDRPTIIHVNLDRLQVKQTELEVEYWKLEAN
jgi:hypothetical protein